MVYSKQYSPRGDHNVYRCDWDDASGVVTIDGDTVGNAGSATKAAEIAIERCTGKPAASTNGRAWWGINSPAKRGRKGAPVPKMAGQGALIVALAASGVDIGVIARAIASASAIGGNPIGSIIANWHDARAKWSAAADAVEALGLDAEQALGARPDSDTLEGSLIDALESADNGEDETEAAA